ncbi:hypothetical protein [Aureispira anguillae]|uniref:Uncharacterized protein n=1 Tax=Aureispira anguillae TaxID=2864201 RepID=A0A915YI50_9BACT|nr:hypothetical protein [Aureispira anguillae]BDS13485.1 hypothetical protein AsAng_0042230 [Aureispira anguillae]
MSFEQTYRENNKESINTKQQEVVDQTIEQEFSDQSPEAIQMRQLQDHIDNSLHTLQLKQWITAITVHELAALFGDSPQKEPKTDQITKNDSILFPVDDDGQSEAYFNRIYQSANPTTRAKLDLLKASSINYEINTNVWVGDMLDPNAEAHSVYDFSISAFVISIKRGLSESEIIQSLGDELEHAYQFEIGRIGYEKLQDGSSQVFSYDMQDEIDSKKAAILALARVNATENKKMQRSAMHQSFITALKEGNSGIQAYFEKYIGYTFDGFNIPQKQMLALDQEQDLKTRFEKGKSNGYIFRQKEASDNYATTKIESD